MQQGEVGAKNTKDTSKVHVSSAQEVLQRVVEMLPEKNDPPEAIPVAISTKSQGFPEKTELVVACSCTAGGDSSLKYNQVPTLSWLALQTCG